MNKKHFDIVFVADNAYAPYTSVTLQSLFKFHPQWQFDIWLLSCNFSTENTLKYEKHCFTNNAKFHLLVVSPNELDPYDNIGFWSKYTFLKLFIANKLPHTVHHVLYLDGDMLITDSLEELFQTSLQNYSLAAVEDLAFVKTKNITQFGMDTTAISINSGVMLMNLERWRKASNQNLYTKFINQWRNKFSLCDQDVINNVFANQIKPLPLRYNLTHFCFGVHIKQFLTTSHLAQWKSARLHPAIIHFTNNTKPWIWENIHYYKSQYLKVASQTPYAQYFTHYKQQKYNYNKKIYNLFRYTIVRVIDIFRLYFLKNL